MIPTEIFMYAGFALTPNGKVDRSRLGSQDQRRTSVAIPFVAPADELERRLTNMFQRLLNVDSVGVNDRFFDLGGDSLAALELVETIAVLFGRALDTNVLLSVDTPRGLARLIQDATTPLGTAIVPIQPWGNRAPFFCVHGGGGEVLFLTEMRRHLSRQQPFYGLSPPGLATGSGIPTTVEAFADLYAEEIRRFDPVGPYLLGGLCFGGNIAVETGRRLLDDGADVPVVVLFDTVYPRKLPVWNAIAREVVSKWWRSARRPSDGRGISRLATLLRARPIGSVEWTILRAVTEYVPEPYPGRIAAFLGDGPYFPPWTDPRLAWTSTAQGGLDVRHVNGVRSKMFGPQHGPHLASRLETYLRSLVSDAAS